MSNYAAKTWVNGVDATNQTNLNHIEQGIAAVPGFYTISPYHLLTTVTINNGTTNTPTCTGVGGVPSGAKAVWINFVFSPSGSGTYATFTPHGTAWGAANYPVSNVSTGTTNITGSFPVILDGSGKLDIAANGGNCSTMDVQIIGYII